MVYYANRITGEQYFFRGLVNQDWGFLLVQQDGKNVNGYYFTLSQAEKYFKSHSLDYFLLGNTAAAKASSILPVMISREGSNESASAALSDLKGMGFLEIISYSDFKGGSLKGPKKIKVLGIITDEKGMEHIKKEYSNNLRPTEDFPYFHLPDAHNSTKKIYLR